MAAQLLTEQGHSVVLRARNDARKRDAIEDDDEIGMLGKLNGLIRDVALDGEELLTTPFVRNRSTSTLATRRRVRDGDVVRGDRAGPGRFTIR